MRWSTLRERVEWRMINRARQIAMLTRVPSDGMRDWQMGWLAGFEGAYGRPGWVRWVVGRRLRKRRLRWEELWVREHSDIIDLVHEKMKEGEGEGP